MKIGDKIKELRKDMQMTQSELATKANLDEKYISQLENHRRSPSVKTLFKIARALNKTPGFLLANTDNKTYQDLLADPRLKQLLWDISELPDRVQEEVADYVGYIKKLKGKKKS